MSFVDAFRGPFLENRHAVTVVVTDPDGCVRAASGDPDMTMVLRSTAKPFQAQALFKTGAMDAHDVSSQELALACASHDSMPFHIDLVAGWLDRIGLDESALGCGPHLPGNEAARDALIRGLGAPTPIHNNCSGKHTGMLCACRAAGWPTDGYLDPTHPLQREILDTLRRLAEAPVMTGGIDGCSAPTFGVAVRGLATMYARLAEPSGAPADLREGLGAARDAMRAHPDLVAGPTTIDTLLMRAFPGMVCKRGAAGGYGIALEASRFGPLGAAVWVHDGASDARGAAIFALIDFLGLEPRDPAPLEALDALARYNCRNAVVGRLETELDLVWTPRSKSRCP